MATGSKAEGTDAAATMVLAFLLILLTGYLIGGVGVVRWYAMLTGMGAVGLCGSMVRDSRRAANLRLAVRADLLAEQMAQVATWCGQLSEYLWVPERRAELSQGAQVRLARVIIEGERALTAWGSGPAARRRLGRFERLTGRLLPEIAAGLRRACHEHVIAVWGRRL